MTRTFISASIATLLALVPATASAETVCGSYQRSWNVPTGGSIVLKQSDLIDKIIGSVGEYYTHNALSRNASTSLVYHSTAEEPGMCFYLFHGVVPCTDDIKKGGPGPSRAYASSFYYFLYTRATLTSLGWADGGSAGVSTVNWLDYPTGGVTMSYKGSGLYEYKYNGTDMFYRLDQYKNDYSTEYGTPTSSPGMVCSTFVAWALNRATGQVITDKTYPGSQVGYATGQLRQAIKDQCHDEANWFEDIFANCAGSADKVANCFHSYDKCSKVNKWYQDVQYQNAYSVSPDRIPGRGNNDGGGPWMNKPIQTLTWSGSSLYGCWEN